MKFLYWILASASYSSSTERIEEDLYLSSSAALREASVGPAGPRRRPVVSGTTIPVNDAEIRSPPNKRVARDTTRRRLPLRIQRIIEFQAFRESQFRYYPVLSFNHETVPEFGTLTIKDLLGAGKDSNVFSVVERVDVVIKYQSKRVGRGTRYPLHPLVVDFWIGGMASRLGVAAKPHFVSLGQMSNNGASIKTSGFEGDGIVRYMVLERVGRCLDSFIVDPIGLYKSAVVALSVVGNIQTLHNAGICHGDIHSGNICMKEPKLVFIDFGLSFFSTEESFTRSKPRMSYVHRSLTPWQLEGYSFSRRDDIYKAISLMAEAAIGSTRFWQGKSELVKTDPEELLAWKREGNLFVSGDYDPVERDPRLSPEEKTIARNILQEILRIVRGLSDAEIPYDSIITLLGRIIQLYR
jgi:serine/threonine protein kinase